MLNKIATLEPEAKGKLGILILSLIKILIFYSSWVFLRINLDFLMLHLNIIYCDD